MMTSFSFTVVMKVLVSVHKTWISCLHFVYKTFSDDSDSIDENLNKAESMKTCWTFEWAKPWKIFFLEKAKHECESSRLLPISLIQALKATRRASHPFTFRNSRRIPWDSIEIEGFDKKELKRNLRRVLQVIPRVRTLDEILVNFLKVSNLRMKAKKGNKVSEAWVLRQSWLLILRNCQFLLE